MGNAPDQSHPRCICKGFYQPPNCPIHGGQNRERYQIRDPAELHRDEDYEEVDDAMGIASLEPETKPEDMHNLRVDFGKYRGELWTRVLVQYLNWMVNAGHNKASLAQAELKRRGSTVPDIEITPHAINRMSLKCMDLWSMYQRDGEGLHAWMVRNAKEALENNRTDHADRYLHCRMRWVIDTSMATPVLKTVMPRSVESEYPTLDTTEAERLEIKRGMLASLRQAYPEDTEDLEDDVLWAKLQDAFRRDEDEDDLCPGCGDASVCKHGTCPLCGEDPCPECEAEAHG